MTSRREEMLREELGRWRVLAGDLAVADWFRGFTAGALLITLARWIGEARRG